MPKPLIEDVNFLDAGSGWAGVTLPMDGTNTLVINSPEVPCPVENCKVRVRVFFNVNVTTADDSLLGSIRRGTVLGAGTIITGINQDVNAGWNNLSVECVDYVQNVDNAVYHLELSCVDATADSTMDTAMIDVCIIG